MSGPDLKPLLGAVFARPSEDFIMTNSIQNNETDAMASTAAPAEKQISMRDPDTITQHPISQGAAHDLCQRYVGIGAPRRYRRWIDCLPVWWERLRSAPTPEEKLSCEHMINALNRAAGMHLMEHAARIAVRNKERIEREEAEESAAEKAAEAAAAIDRWR